MRYMVTGGAGFIGSNFVKSIVGKGDEILVLDVLTYAGNLENLAPQLNGENVLVCSDRRVLTEVTLDDGRISFDIDPSAESETLTGKLEGMAFEKTASVELQNSLSQKFDSNEVVFLHGDIGDTKIVGAALEEVDVVVNFAAETHVDRSIHEPDKFIKTDVHGTFNLLECARKSSNLTKFVHISTDEVYGVAYGDTSFKETDSINPRNPYSASKAAADRLVHAYNQTYGLATNIIRPSNNFGPFQHPEKLIPKMISNALNDQNLPIYGDGSQIRDWLFVKDTAAAVELVVRDGQVGEVYNVAGNNERTNMTVVTGILENLGKDGSLIKHVKDRPGHDIRYSVDDSKIREELGFKNADSFENYLEQTVQWYVDNKDWWTRILEHDAEFKRFNEAWYKDRK